MAAQASSGAGKRNDYECSEQYNTSWRKPDVEAKKEHGCEEEHQRCGEASNEQIP